MISLKKIRVYLVMTFHFAFEFFANFWKPRKMCESTTQLNNRVVVITGANTGIGKETAYQLSLRGAKIIIGSRDVNRGERARQQILDKNSKADITVLKLDLCSLTSVRQFVKSIEEKVSKIDILINNAGVFLCPESQTEDGFEMHFATNYLGHFLLTLCLLPLIKTSTKARIISVSSDSFRFGKINLDNINLERGAYDPMKAYCQSKLAINLFTRELAKRLGPNSDVNTYCLHPGFVSTDITRNFISCLSNKANLVILNPELGAQTTLYCALEKSLDYESGHHYDDCHRIDKMPERATNENISEKLWEMSCSFVKLEKELRI